MFAAHRTLTAFTIFAALGFIGPGMPVRAHEPKLHVAPPSEQSPAVAVFERTPRFDYEPPEPGTYELPALRQAGDGNVLDTDGARHRLGDVFKGRIVLFSLIYSLCSDVNGCPLATAVLYDIFNASAHDPNLSRNLRIVSLSFDPKRDTPAAIADYAAPIVAAGTSGGRKSDWVFLTTESEKAIAPILDSYDQVVSPGMGLDSAPGALDHILYVYLIDRVGQVRNIYTLSFLDPRLILADIKTLLLESGRTARP